MQRAFKLTWWAEYEPKITKILSTELVCLNLEISSFPGNSLDELWAHLMKMLHLKDFSLHIKSQKMHKFDCGKIANTIRNCVNLRSMVLTTHPLYPDEEQWLEVCHSLKLSKINKLHSTCTLERVTSSSVECLKLLQRCYGIRNQLLLVLRVTPKKPLSENDKAFLEKTKKCSTWVIRTFQKKR